MASSDYVYVNAINFILYPHTVLNSKLVLSLMPLSFLLSFASKISSNSSFSKLMHLKWFSLVYLHKP